MSEPRSDRDTFDGGDRYLTRCSRCQVEIRSYRPFDGSLRYVCNGCGKRQRSEV